MWAGVGSGSTECRYRRFLPLGLATTIRNSAPIACAPSLQAWAVLKLVSGGLFAGEVTAYWSWPSQPMFDYVETTSSPGFGALAARLP